MYPEIRFSAEFAIPTYFLFLSLLFSFLVVYVFRRAQKLKTNVDLALHLSLLIMAFGLIGGRALHVLYEQPKIYLANPELIFQIWQGGFVFYGGAIAATLACAVTLYRRHENFWAWADFFAPAVSLGYGLGRISCFLAGCCYGKACVLPWAVKFQGGMATRHPTQLYTTAWELIGFAVLIYLEKKTELRKKYGLLFSGYLVWHALGRIVIELYRDDFRGDLIAGISLSSWISFGIFGAGLWLLFDRSRQKI